MRNLEAQETLETNSPFLRLLATGMVLELRQKELPPWFLERENITRRRPGTTTEDCCNHKLYVYNCWKH